MFVLKPTTQFKKDYKLCLKRGLDMQKLENVLRILAAGTPIPPHYKDHPLRGNWTGYRDLHIEPDWVLIYKIEGCEIVLLAATGSHSDLLSK